MLVNPAAPQENGYIRSYGSDKEYHGARNRNYSHNTRSAILSLTPLSEDIFVANLADGTKVSFTAQSGLRRLLSQANQAVTNLFSRAA